MQQQMSLNVDHEAATVSQMGKRKRPKPSKLPWWAYLLGVLYFPFRLLVYLLPIILGVGPILVWGYVFGDDGLREKREVERVFALRDQAAFQALPLTRQREAVRQLQRLVDLGEKTKTAASISCPPERIPLAQATLQYVDTVRATLPTTMVAVREQLTRMVSGSDDAINHCRVWRGRSTSTAPPPIYGDTMWVLTQQLNVLKTSNPAAFTVP